MSCVEEIFLFQKKLNKYSKLNEADKVLYYLHKLNHLHVTVSHLEETGVGKTVNALRHQGGKVEEKARSLVNKWKAMVTAEEEEEEEEITESHSGIEETGANPSKNEGEDHHQQQQDEYKEEEDDDCLQIEENVHPIYNEEGEESHPAEDSIYEQPSYSPTVEDTDDYNPATSRIDYLRRSGAVAEDEIMESYNPKTSEQDFQAETWLMTGQHHPTSVSDSPVRDDSGKDWKNGKSVSSPAKRSKEDKEGNREKQRSKKRKHRDSSSSNPEREKKKSKHKEGSKEKHTKAKHHHQHHKEGKHKGEHHINSSTRDERESDCSAVNGFNSSTTPCKRDRDGEGHKSEHKVTERTKVEKEKPKNVKEKHKREHKDKKEDRKPSKKDKSKLNSNNLHKDKIEGEEEEGERSVRAGKRKQSKTKHRKHRDSSSSSNSSNDSDSSSSSSSSSNSNSSSRSSSNNKRNKRKKDSHINKRKEQHQSPGEKKKAKNKPPTSVDSGFGAMLMGLDSQMKKKGKKRKKIPERDQGSVSEEVAASSSSGKQKKGPQGQSGMPYSKKPKLLSASLEALPQLPPLDVADEKPLLPEITPNYKPLPRLPVKDENPESCFTKMTEEEALNFVFQSKSNRRSKVYSGKVCGLSFVPSLYDSCIRVLQENIDALEYTGGIPFEILRPVLERATPKQLLNLEDYNHYLLEDSDVLWEAHCKRDFKKMKPEEMESWREMWLRCSDERDKRLKSLTHNLTEKFLTKAEPKRTTKIAYVDTAAKVPRSVARAQAKYGTAASSILAAKPGKANEIAARKSAMQNVQRVERAANPRPVAAKKKKVAPLMAKTKQFFKKAFRR